MQEKIFNNPRRICIGILLVLFVFFNALFCLFIRCRTRNMQVWIGDMGQNNSESEKIEYRINSVTELQDTIQIEGWAVQKGIQYPYYNYGIDENSKGVYNKMRIGYADHKKKKATLFPTILEKSAEANETVNDGIDYKYCGFVCTISKSDYNLAQQNGFLVGFCDPNGKWSFYPIEVEDKDE